VILFIDFLRLIYKLKSYKKRKIQWENKSSI